MKICGRDIKVDGRLIRIARIDADKYQFLDDPEPVLDELRRSGSGIDLFTFMQKLPETSPRYDYPWEWDNFAAVPVSTYDHWWTEQIDSKTRNMVRKAEKKGVEVREVPFDDTLIRGISEIYNESPIRQGLPFPHYGKDIETLRKIKATYLDSSTFIGAFFEGKLIGFIKLTTNETRTQAGLMHIVSMNLHRDKAPTNALIAQAVRACAERGVSYLVYSNFAYGKKQQSSLSDFKERNGFQRIELPRYYVPLTLLGKVAFRLGLHHKFVDRLPESLATRLRDIRKTWYNHQMSSTTEAS
jgi:hypothetical protein